MKIGDAFKVVDATIDKHLWVVGSDPEKPRVVLLNLTTYTADEENVCILVVGDHPFITHKSAIAYWGARCVPPTNFDKLIKERKIELQAPASDEMMQKIWAGACLSKRITAEALSILREQKLLSD